MTNPFETITEQQTKNFIIGYRNAKINVRSGERYRLTWPDQRWMLVDCQEDFSKVRASSDADSRHVIPCSWVMLENSGGPAWINAEQLQVIGELIRRKEAL